MKVVIPKAELTFFVEGKKKSLKKNNVYIFSDVIYYFFSMSMIMQGVNIESKINVKNIDEIYEKLSKENINNAKKVAIIRTGGIGDLIALSSITSFLSNKFNKQVYFITQEKYKDLFKFFDKRIIHLFYFDPIDIYNQLKRQFIHGDTLKTLYFEGIIENSKENWYELQFKRADIFDMFTEEYGRPHLTLKNIKDDKSKNIEFKKYKTILVNPKSTSKIRSTNFIDIYQAIKNVIKDDKSWKIYVHEKNLRQYELEKIRDLNDDRIAIIKANSLYEFLLDAVFAHYVIAVDTAIVHFREAIEKPYVGIYAAFSTEARTKYYKYGINIDVPFDKCGIKPCFIHTRKHFEHCDYANKLRNYCIINDLEFEFSPCTFSKTNENYVNFLTKYIEKMLNMHE